MSEKLEQIKAPLKTASGQVKDAATKVVDHPNTRAVATRAKDVAIDVPTK